MKRTYMLITLAASMSFAAKIGVLTDACPNERSKITISLDAEDKNNITEYYGDDKTPIGIGGTKSVAFTYCVYDYDELPRVPYDYVVLRLDDKCPEGALAFARFHDTEDKNNENSPKGDFQVSPSVIDDDAKLEYCFVPAEKNAKYPYPFQKEFGVFANPSSSSNVMHNWVKIDDEDTKNKNDWDWHGITDNSIKKRIKKIVEDGKDVVYHTIKWTGDEKVLPPMSSLWRTTIGVKASCQREFTITLDVENHNNNTKVTAGSSDHPGIDLEGHVDFDYCVIDASNKSLYAQYDYVVLRTSQFCPLGSKSFARYHDTENSKNKNAPKGSSAVWPSVIDDNARLEYCLVSKRSDGKAYPFSASYGVFANNPGVNNIIYTEFRVDDEDDVSCTKEELWQEPVPKFDEEGNYIGDDLQDYYRCVEKRNNNHWYFRNRSLRYVENIMYDDGKDTYFRYIHWNGKSLKKEANMVVVEQAAPAAQPLSPEIKGFDHSAVTVELKSAGSVNVSIVNLKGAVVANIARENLQPGFHSLEWHSGIVPNGRYIVTVKQNGLVSAKNVILK